MASKIINDKTQIAGRTEFQLHISQLQSYYSNRDTLCDFTEHKLRLYIKNNQFDDQKLVLIKSILNDYVSGKVAIAWKQGEPVYIRINKNI